MAPAAIGLSLLSDLVLEEWPDPIHPVACFGRLVEPVDRRWAHPLGVGVLVAAVVPLGVAVIAAALTALALQVSTAIGILVAAMALFSTTSLRMLVSVASGVIARADRDIEGARTAVRALVGRDTTALSPAEIRSAAVESAAENLSDGLVAPLAAFAIGAQVALPVAVAAAVWVKAINSLDSMIGYRSKRVGWASARLDDVVMWLPARLSAVLIALAGRSPGALGRARAWSQEPASPNAGWPMATLAAVLDVQLTKSGAYVLQPDRALPTAAQAHRGIQVVGIAGLLAFALAGVVTWF